jgi:hypothetical protein
MPSRRRGPSNADARVRQPIAATGKAAVIPPRPHRLPPADFDRDLYKARHLIENFFCMLAPAPRATTKPQEISSPPLLSGSIDDTP